ncbi:MAG: FtsH protease activity modulator HflK [Lactobacillus sp.]|jgi:membrane protease subunit HflK|nr:FtsH protease activity modulator HflK [Lactobacillus sp.]
MTKVQGPWGGADETPWGDAHTATQKPKKVVQMPKVATSDDSQDGGFKVKWIILGLLALWLASGFYQVQPAEQGVVLRFGAYAYTTESGLRYHLPYPIENVEKVNITAERSITLGVTNNSSDFNSFTESHMLTGDENIVDINLTVVWKIKDAKDYLFSMREPDQTVRVAAQSVLREIIGQSQMQSIITGDRGKVEDDTKEELQNLLNSFNSGIHIVRVKLQKADPPKQVVDAFNEVQRARADMERFKNEAEAYRNEILPQARGEAAQITQNAEAYKEAVIKKAQGDADRFTSVYQAYRQGREVTIKRLYLETLENVLSKSNKTIIDPSSKGQNVLPLLNVK